MKNANEINHPCPTPEKRGYELIGDHYYRFMKDLHEEDRETAVKLYRCRFGEFFKITMNWEYERGKRFYYYTTETSFLPGGERGLRETSCRKDFLLVTPDRITQRGLMPGHKRRLPFNELQNVYQALSDFEDVPTLEELFDIYNPRLKYTLPLPADLRYPAINIIKRRELYTLEKMAGYILKDIPKDKGAQILLNIDGISPNAQLAFINKAAKVSRNPGDTVKRLLAQEPPYSMKSIFRTPYRQTIILADRLGYEVDWDWPIETWEEKSDKWEKEEDELLALIPEVIFDPPDSEGINDDIPF